MIKSIRFYILALACLLSVPCVCRADMIYLNNGNKMEGIIRSEDERSVDVEIGFGTTRIRKDRITTIEKWNEADNRALTSKWELKKQENQRKAQELMQAQAENSQKPVQFIEQTGHIIVEALLNKKVMTSLMMDTGASLVVLSSGVAKKLGLDLDNIKKTGKMEIGDGRLIEAKIAVLDSISIKGVEAKNVEVAILSEEVSANIKDSLFPDGLLGMSYLKHFNYKVNQKEKKLVLEKLSQ